MASPVLADLHGLPPLLIQAADTELLYDDAVRLNEKALASGVQSKLHIYPGLPHVWQMFIGTVPEAGAALHEIADFVQEKIGKNATAGTNLKRGFRSGNFIFSSSFSFQPLERQAPQLFA
jgi:acetyl esterase/lipase